MCVWILNYFDFCRYVTNHSLFCLRFLQNFDVLKFLPSLVSFEDVTPRKLGDGGDSGH